MSVVCVIPHYGKDELLDKCLKGVAVNGLDKYQIVVVNSNPPQPRRLFTEAVNVGLKNVLDCPGLAGVEAIWVLNNDCIPQPGCVSAAMRLFADEKSAGVVGSQNRWLENPDRIVWGGSLEPFPFGRHKCGLASKGELQTRTLEMWVTFSSVFLRVDMVQEIGLLDKNLQHIFSDSDYCLRALSAEWDVWHCPDSVVHHACGSSMVSGGNAPWLEEVKRGDQAHFHKKWMRGILQGGSVGFPLRPKPEKIGG